MQFGFGGFRRAGFGAATASRFTFHSSPSGFGGFPRRADYPRMVEEYKHELEAALEAVQREIDEVKGSAAPERES